MRQHISLLHSSTRVSCLCAIILLLLPGVSLADTVAVGYLSFDVLIPGAPGSPGTNGFTIGNLTGDPSLGGNDLPPTWPVITSLTFQASSLELVEANCTQNCTQTYSLGDLGPQFFQSFDLQFPDTAAFASATFTATLNTTDFQLDGGGTFTAASSQISAVLLPSTGNSLVAGTDSVLITVSNQTAAAPEPPASAALVVSLTSLLWWRRRKAERRPAPQG
jgi:hypothetical protein